MSVAPRLRIVYEAPAAEPRPRDQPALKGTGGGTERRLDLPLG